MKNPTTPDVVPVPPDHGVKGGKSVKGGKAKSRKPQSLKPKDGVPIPPDPGTKGGGVKNFPVTPEMKEDVYDYPNLPKESVLV